MDVNPPAPTLVTDLRGQFLGPGEMLADPCVETQSEECTAELQTGIDLDRSPLPGVG
jgi:hypothetical protein